MVKITNRNKEECHIVIKETFHQTLVTSVKVILKHVKQKLTQWQREIHKTTGMVGVLACFSQTLTDQSGRRDAYGRETLVTIHDEEPTTSTIPGKL